MTKQGEEAKNLGRRRWVAGVKVLLVAIAVGGFLLQCEKKPAPAPAPVGPDSSKLAGRWLRPDGGYVLELSEIGPDGRLKAGYLNPRPINVARAEWKLVEGRLGVFVEFHDRGYEGSTYTLAYHPAVDRLAGIYFQASRGQHFEVVFERIP